ncbi:hypothetical protein [Mycobacterium sp. NPDC050853]|uniref:hypothetical protein n=1 Tax=Mycobacterium sp. NPDC050853 TaxID=3155160 RepID=UPI0033F81E9E
MAVHGVAGYAAGCRCEECAEAQQAREKAIADAERARWASVRPRAEIGATQRQRLERAENAALARVGHQWRKQAKAAGRRDRERQRQQQAAASERRQAKAEAEYARQRREAIATSDYRWLLDDQRLATKHVRNRIAVVQRQAQPGTLDELLLHQAQQIHQLIEQHHAELVRHSQNPDG